MKKALIALTAVAAALASFAAEEVAKPQTFAEAAAAYELAPSRDTAYAAVIAAKPAIEAGKDLTTENAFFEKLKGSDDARVRNLAALYEFEVAYYARDYAKARPLAVEAEHAYGLYSCDSRLLTAGQIKPELVVADVQDYLARKLSVTRAVDAGKLFDLWYEAALAAELPDAEVKAALVKFRRLFLMRSREVAEYKDLEAKSAALLELY